jgi:CBS-domain-containing membrane protein
MHHSMLYAKKSYTLRVFNSSYIPAKGGIMLKAKDIMTRDVITVSPETEIIQAAKLLLSERINGVPVVNHTGELVGILCQSDLIAQQKSIPIPSLFTLLDGYIPLTRFNLLDKEVEKIVAIKVANAMTPDPMTVNPDTDIDKIAALMVEKNYHTLPVVDGRKLLGVVGKEDVLKTLLTGTDK